MKPNKRSGFTLFEMLLVLVIVSSFIVMGANYFQQRSIELRVDRAVTQTQQILNAALAYYIATGAWPQNLATLKTNGAYLPTNSLTATPWGTQYTLMPSPQTPSSLVFVYFQVTSASSSGTAPAIANMIAGRLPLSYVTETASAGSLPVDNGTCRPGSTSSVCYVVAAVNIPGQNLNNASAVNFSNVYHSGACVPVPTCPVDANGIRMTPQITVVPISINGVNDGPNADSRGSTCTNGNVSGCVAKVYPISSFTANAVGPAVATASGGPPSCDGRFNSSVCIADTNGSYVNIDDNNQYWRVCLSITTEKGVVKPQDVTWGQISGTVMAITRCAPANERTGSNFNVWAI